MSAADPQTVDDYNAAMREKILALGAVPVTDDLLGETSMNRLWRQLLLLLSGGGAAQQSFVFRPGAVAPLPDGVYNDWATLYAAAIQAPGPITIYFDNTLVDPAPIIIPAGNWDFPRWDVTLAGAIAFSFIQVALSPETTLNGVANIDNFLAIFSSNALGPVITAPPTTPGGTPAVLVLGRGAQIFTFGAAPFVEIPTDGFYAIGMLNQAAFSTANIVSVLDGTLGVTALLMFCQDGATVPFDSIRSTGVNTLTQFIFAAASKMVDFTGQPNFLGSIFTDLFDSAGNIQYLEGNLADWSGTAPGTVANALDRLAAHVGPVP